MRTASINPTASQIAALERLKKRIAERGFLIARVHPDVRRHASDFAAIPKSDPQQFSIVRIGKTFLVVRPFGTKRNDLIAAVNQSRTGSPVRIMHTRQQLRYKKGRFDEWRHFVDPTDHAEIEQLHGR